jgi:F-type H+-transporting ATPase subunit a
VIANSIAVRLQSVLSASGEEGGGFHAPSISEFFPGPLLFEGTLFELSRINAIGLFMTGVLCLFFVLAFSKNNFVPRGIQNLGEMAVDFVQVQIIDEILGHKGARYAVYLTSMFWLLLAFNITGILPLMHISVTSVIGFPFFLAMVSWIVFNVEGVRANGPGAYLKNNLFPAGVPAPIYILVTPIEFISTFILRPVTLTVRLLANMMSGHLLLVLFFGATQYFLIESDGIMKAVAIPSFFMGFAFTLFEILVAFLQAYIFTLLTAVYIDGATSAEH